MRLLNKAFVRLMALGFAFALAPSAFALDGTQVVTGGGSVDFTGASSTNWVVNPETGALDFIMVFSNPEEATAKFELHGIAKARVLAVGGGGGGGGRHRTDGTAKAGGGGGGAGGLVLTNYLLSAEAPYVIAVGAGGPAASNVRNTNPCPGENGGDTTITTNGFAFLTACGGGGGGGQSPGNAGGSGGGGAMNTTSAPQDPGAQSAEAAAAHNVGHAGGRGDAAGFGGGGGGAGGAGKLASEGGAGGAGFASDITGASVTYAVGGSGGDKATKTNGATADTPGSGGGGGGGNTATTAADGKPGIVVVRVIAASGGPLDKPADSAYTADGVTSHVVIEDNPFYTVTGVTEAQKEPGVYVATARLDTGVTWTDGSTNDVTATMTIAESGTYSDEVTVNGGVKVSFAGASTNFWLYNEGTKTNDLVIGFTRFGCFTLPGSSQVELLAVGGGGGGGGRHRTDGTAKAGGGGGGAGGLILTNTFYTAGTYAVSVGAGGPAASNVRNTNPCPGENGGDTTITTNGFAFLTAYGGGGGGGQSPGNAGGSGGGGAMDTTSDPQDPGAQSDEAAAAHNLGHAGGRGDATGFGGGGGGAGGAGKLASEGGAGGAGFASDITGASVTYAVGGSGGDKATGTSGAAADAPGSGGGGAGKNTASTASDGQPGIVYVRISAAMKGDFKKPTDPEPVVYDRNPHTSIVDTIFYTVSGENVGTTAGVYVATATLRDPKGSWPEGGSGPVDVTLTITKRHVEFSDLKIAGWEYLSPSNEPSCKVDPDWATPLYEYKPKDGGEWSRTVPTLVGTYLLRVGVADTDNFSFTPVDPVEFEIGRIAVTISGLKQHGWMAGTPREKIPPPTFTVTPAWASNYVECTYADSETSATWSREPPTAVGTHWAKVDVIDKASFAATPATASFEIADGLGDLFTDYVEITIGGHTPELADYPVQVSLSEESPTGFLYARAGKTGNEMTFTLADGKTPLDYRVETWNTNGTSVVYVRLPLVTTASQVIRLYWNLHDGTDAPEHHPEKVWEKWTPEDWKKQTQPTVAYKSPVSRNGYLVNYFDRLPRMSKYFWDVSDAEKGRITTAAKLKFESSTLLVRTFTNVVAQVGYETLPTDIVGSFRVCYTLVDPSDRYEPLETHMDYAVSGRTPWGDLRGSGGDLTRSGRVLLMNDDVLDEVHSVSNQSYWQTREVDRGDGTVLTNDVFWTHEGAALTYTYNPNLLYGTSHRLYARNDDGTTNLLWRLENCRIGNTVGANSTFRNSRLNLPWSATGLGISKWANYARQGDIDEAGQIVMRNMGDIDKPAESPIVYSPCYTNGIGTIYFDAVNGQMNYINADAYRIVVEVATATYDGKTPTDQNAYGPNEDGLETELGKIRAAQWHPVEATLLYHNGAGSAFEKVAVTNDLSLKANVMASTNHFYRICVTVDCSDACRFRIRRVSSVPTSAVNTDEDQFIQLDNIIVTYPNMTTKAQPYFNDKYDAARAGKEVLGWQAAMATPFPAAGAADVRARVAVKSTVNDFVFKRPEDVVLVTKMFYRLRYLDQAYYPSRPEDLADDENGRPTVVPELRDAATDPDLWRSVEIWPADGYVSRDALMLPDSEGDLEFRFVSSLNVPTYEFYDYSGASLDLAGADGKPLYVYENLVVTNGYRLSEGEVLPSTGSDWFVRLRPGASDFEGVRLLTRPKGGAEVTTNAMELTGAGLWRGVVATPAELADGLEFRFEGYNRQQPAAAEYVANVEGFRAAEKVTRLPADLPYETADADAWSEAPCDAKTGYLLFQLNERKTSVYVAHADYQNFNRWASAANTNGLFVGSTVDTNSTTYVAQQYAVDWTTMAPTVTTNASWAEDFSVSTALVARLIYPRNEPFASAVSLNGWTAENGMWTYGKWAIETADGFGDDTSLQLQGRGLGRLSMDTGSSIPEGIDTVTYHARLAQFNDFDNFTYFNGMVGSVHASMASNYTFCAGALMTYESEDAFHGDGSLSLVAHYVPGVGCYEFRLSRGTSKSQLKLALYRWSVKGRAISCDELGVALAPLSTANNLSTEQTVVRDWYNPVRKEYVEGNVGGLYISAHYTGAGTVVKAGVYRGDLKTYETSAMMGSSKPFFSVAYFDKAKPLKRGSFGLLTRNCPGIFTNPIYYPAAIATTLGKDNELVPDANATTTISFTGKTPVNPLKTDSEYEFWVTDPGRSDRMRGALLGGMYGFQAVTDLMQQVEVQVADHGKGNWKAVATNEVYGFTSTEFSAELHSTKPSDVRLQVMGSVDDSRTDVVVTDIALSQWVAPSTPDYDDAGTSAYPDDWVYTCGMVNQTVSADKTYTNRTLRLQPTRAPSETQAVSLRTPRMRGFGLLHLAWKDADPRAVLRVQVARDATANNMRTLTKAPSDDRGWETIGEPLSFAALGASGETTVYVNKRHPWEGLGGVMRVVVDRAVMREATAEGVSLDDPDYGAVTITDLFTWDLPEYDMHSWTGWNFRTAGWDGNAAGPFANLTDGGATHGQSGLLNNTLEASTLADDVTDYKANPPNVQSPTFGTNCIGAVDFRARLYDRDDLATYGHAAVVTVYGARDKDEWGEPRNWYAVENFVISNGFYRTYTKRFRPSDKFCAIRFAVKGVAGVDGGETPVYDPPCRVAIDDVCIYERPSLDVAFRRLCARPFRNAESIKGTEAVRDISSVNEQPLLGEAFGFQAEVDVRSEEIAANTLKVELWYYPSAEPWGFDNWRKEANAVRVDLDAATGESLIFRSMASIGGSLCPPQFLEKGEEYKTVQYHFIAHYEDASGEKFEHELSSEDWSMPSWNSGLKDPNEKDGAAFSAFTVLEAIAPKRAWINEVNYTEDTDQKSMADQWVEIAVPSGVDMTGWHLDVHDKENDKVVELLRFGANGAPASKQVSGDESHYDFYVVKSPSSTLTADATWPSFKNGSVSSGRLNFTCPYGFELVRPTGVVEHRAVVQGWNQFTNKWYGNEYDGTNLVRVLNERCRAEDWVWAEEDKHLYPGCTVGVTNGTGSVHEEWYSPMGRTPGLKNEGQYIDPNWFVYPNGGYYAVVATVTGGHIRQIHGDETNSFLRLMVQEGATTSLVYEVDRWYKLGPCKVTPGGFDVSGPTVKDRRSYYTLTVRDVRAQTDVTASAAVSDELAGYGVTNGNAYANAIMRWLEEGDFEGDEIKLGEYRGVSGERHDEVDLTALYWLDLDPTRGGWELWGGMGDKPDTGKPGLEPAAVVAEMPRENPDFPGVWHTNIVTKCWLMIKNANDLSYAPRPPNRLQGLANEQSDRPESYSGSWTSVTFKVEMMLKTDDETIMSQWHPMRQFVFGPDSFRPATAAISPFAAQVEITDPYSRQSPAWEWSWWKYKDSSLKPFTRFSLSTGLTPAGVKTLHYSDLLKY